MNKVVIIIVMLVVAVGAALLVNKIFHKPKASSSTVTNSTTATIGVNDSLQQQDIQVGTGTAAKNGDKLSVHYTGTLKSGTVFDSNVGKSPFSFTLGAGSVIKGWDEGLVGMKMGGRRKLVIPPSLGYGDQATGSIPAGSTLYFNVQLVKVN